MLSGSLRIPVKQPGFHGMSCVFAIFYVAHFGNLRGSSKMPARKFGDPGKSCIPRVENKGMSTRWWQLKYVLFSSLLGEDSYFD